MRKIHVSKVTLEAIKVKSRWRIWLTDPYGKVLKDRKYFICKTLTNAKKGAR
jgi:hypothetical protein